MATSAKILGEGVSWSSVEIAKTVCGVEGHKLEPPNGQANIYEQWCTKCGLTLSQVYTGDLATGRRS